MSKAKKAAIDYQLSTYGPRVMGGAGILSEKEYEDWNANRDFLAGYLQAEKDLALTWYEVANLTAIVGMLNNTDFNGNVFEEALRRFNEQRNK